MQRQSNLDENQLRKELIATLDDFRALSEQELIASKMKGEKYRDNDVDLDDPRKFVTDKVQAAIDRYIRFRENLAAHIAVKKNMNISKVTTEDIEDALQGVNDQEGILPSKKSIYDDALLAKINLLTLTPMQHLPTNLLSTLLPSLMFKRTVISGIDPEKNKSEFGSTLNKLFNFIQDLTDNIINKFDSRTVIISDDEKFNHAKSQNRAFTDSLKEIKIVITDLNRVLRSDADQDVIKKLQQKVSDIESRQQKGTSSLLNLHQELAEQVIKPLSKLNAPYKNTSINQSIDAVKVALVDSKHVLANGDLLKSLNNAIKSLTAEEPNYSRHFNPNKMEIEYKNVLFKAEHMVELLEAKSTLLKGESFTENQQLLQQWQQAKNKLLIMGPPPSFDAKNINDSLNAQLAWLHKAKDVANQFSFLSAFKNNMNEAIESTQINMTNQRKMTTSDMPPEQTSQRAPAANTSPSPQNSQRVVMGSSFFNEGKQMATMGQMLEDHQARLNVMLFDKDKFTLPAEDIQKRVASLHELQTRFRDLCKNASHTAPYQVLEAKFEKMYEQYKSLMPERSPGNEQRK